MLWCWALHQIFEMNGKPVGGDKLCVMCAHVLDQSEVKPLPQFTAGYTTFSSGRAFYDNKHSVSAVRCGIKNWYLSSNKHFSNLGCSIVYYSVGCLLQFAVMSSTWHSTSLLTGIFFPTMHYRSNLIVYILLIDIWFEYLFIIQSNGQCRSFKHLVVSQETLVGQPHYKLIRGSGGPSGVFLLVQGIGCRRDVSSHFQAQCFSVDFVRSRLPSNRFCPPPWDKLMLQPSCTSSIAVTAAFSSPHCVWGYWELSIVGSMNLFAATDYSSWWGKKVEVALSRMLFALSACHSALFTLPSPISSAASVERGV